jgi:hypothetical protein
MRRILPLAALCALLLVPSSASAALYGVESNGELTNSDRTLELQQAALDKVVAQGGDIIRANIGWNEVARWCDGQSVAQLRDPDNACYRWSVVDNLVQSANARRVLVLVSVTRVPSWVRDNANPYYLGTRTPDFNNTVAHYAAFMRAFAARYAIGSPHGFVRLYTVWSEPNSITFFKPMHTRFLVKLAPRRYAYLYAQSAIAIKAVNPQAQIAIGPTHPTGGRGGIPPITYVAQLQRVLPAYLPGTGARERSYISAWAHNPYPGIGTPPNRGTARSPLVGMTNIRDLFRQLDRAPLTRGLRVWATEFGYQTNPPDRTLGINPLLQARYMGEAFDWLDSTRRVTVQIWYGLTDPVALSDWQNGTFYSNGRAKPSLYWYRRPISVPVSRVRRGMKVRVWARSNLKPRSTRIAISTNGRRWRVLPLTGRKADGTVVNWIRITRRTWFATYDGTRGPARVVSVR